MKDTCPCCGYRTLSDFGRYDVCPICYWEDDPVQSENPDFEGGANKISLRQAQLNFIIYSASDLEFIENGRPPTAWDLHDPDWLPLYQPPENIAILQQEIQKKKDTPVRLFKALSFLYFIDRARRYRDIDRDIRRFNSEIQQECSKAKSEALKKDRNSQLRHWISKADWASEVDFIINVADDFWKWLKKVESCTHLHLETISESNYIIPLYNCRCCGAYVGCSCWFKDSWPINQHTRVRPSARSEFIPMPVFKEVFIKTNICYRCRKDEDLAAPRLYGRNKIEKVYWRELLSEETAVWDSMAGDDFKTVDEIVEYSKAVQPQSILRNLILDNDDGTIIEILKRALYVKNRMKKMGLNTSIREMLKYAVDIACHVYNDLEDIKEDDYLSGGEIINFEKMPVTIHLPWSYGSKAMLQSLGLDKNPEKILDMPLLFKLAMLQSFLIERHVIDRAEVRKVARSRVKEFDFNPDVEIQRSFEAAKIQDIYLFLKIIQRLWHRDKNSLIKHQNTISDTVTQSGIEWAIMEYKLFCEGNYSGFEYGLVPDKGLCLWLTGICEYDFMSLLKEGKIITNVVGMRHIDWSRYLKMDRYLTSKKVTLIREPDNQFDKYAISAETDGFGKLGYIKRSVAAIIAPIIDNGTMIKAEIVRRYYPHGDIDTTIFLRIKYE